MFAGPIIAREVLTAPRPLRYYVARASFAGLLFILMWTAWQALVGWREVHEFGTLARFGAILFNGFSLLQLTLMLFFAPLAAATAVAHEKDRRTFVLLMMTDLSDLEIVVGKLTASLLQVLTILATSAPVLFLCMLLGGVSFAQLADVVAVTAAAGVVGGALGLVVALWRDRTFQSLALTLLVVVLVFAVIGAIGLLLPEARLLGVPLSTALNPYLAILAVLHPPSDQLHQLRLTSLVFMTLAGLATVSLVAFGTWKLRVWNPGRNEPREKGDDEEAEVVESLVEVEELVGAENELQRTAALAYAGSQTAAQSTTGRGTITAPAEVALGGSNGSPAPGDQDGTTGLHVPRRTHRRIAPSPKAYRKPWTTPIIWRELRTRAYGTKPLIIKGAYLLVFILDVLLFRFMTQGMNDPMGTGWALLPMAMAVLSLLLVNAQAVTALTSERDSGALDLLLVTELSPKEFIYGKLYGALYNTKEMVVLPVLLLLYYCAIGLVSVENTVFVLIDYGLLVHYSAMLGLHAAITYTSSRQAIAHSLGTIFFLLVGILICAFLIILSNSEFGRQLFSFIIFIGVGSVALYGSLGARNPSQAIALVSILTPFWTFYCVISVINGDYMAAFLVSAGIYGFFLLAMLVPAVSDFDIALGRTNAMQG